jgi:hypothetical protein
MDPDSIIILEVFKYLMVLAGLALGVVYGILTYRYRKFTCAIPKGVISFIGFYWVFYYMQSIFGGILPAHQIWVRSPLFVTLMAMLFMGILSLWKMEK